MELIETVQKLQSGKDMAGIELRGSPQFCLGSAIDTGATGGVLEIELEKLNRMIDSGVQFVITNPIFDLQRFELFIKRINTDKIAVIPTVLLLKSAGMARYIDRNVGGVSIPPEIIRGVQKAPDRVKECIRIAGDLITHMKEMGTAGVMIATAGWEDKIGEILDRAKI